MCNDKHARFDEDKQTHAQTDTQTNILTSINLSEHKPTQNPRVSLIFNLLHVLFPRFPPTSASLIHRKVQMFYRWRYFFPPAAE